MVDKPVAGPARDPRDGLRRYSQLLLRKVEEAKEVHAEARKRVEMVSAVLQPPAADGFLEADGVRKTHEYTQAEIVKHLDVGSKAKIFDLDLHFGPYQSSVDPSGKRVLMYGKKGHLAIMDLHSMKLECEINVMQSVRCAALIANQDMFAAAQKKYTYVYDNAGTELHKLKDTVEAFSLEYLPFHHLLVSASRREIRWRDVTYGDVISSHKFEFPNAMCMQQNPRNAVMHVGHSSGQVSLWTPNIPEAAITMQCQHAGIAAMAVDGFAMATSSVDGRWRLWDLRMMDRVSSSGTFGGAVCSMSFSQTGLLSVCNSHTVRVFRNLNQSEPELYLKHRIIGEDIVSAQFRPFEDFCILGRSGGISTLVVPGAGKAHFDSFADNPFATKGQKRENIVKSVLDKIPADMISIDPDMIGKIDPNVKMDEFGNPQEPLPPAEKQKKKKVRQNSVRKNKISSRLKSKAAKSQNEMREKRQAAAKRVAAEREAAKKRNAEKEAESGPPSDKLKDQQEWEPLARFAKKSRTS
mmetsp:Transcript_44356/g.96501  ORF Transcript_44356/g.96501 Transcript_44356/m.96501 type:complete len:523 (+) Transcript_44356:71-1639(+)